MRSPTCPVEQSGKRFNRKSKSGCFGSRFSLCKFSVFWMPKNENIRDGERIEKRKLSLPERIKGVIRCKNPRCITSVEQGLDNEFVLADRENAVYRCAYCESKYERR